MVFIRFDSCLTITWTRYWIKSSLTLKCGHKFCAANERLKCTARGKLHKRVIAIALHNPHSNERKGAFLAIATNLYAKKWRNLKREIEQNLHNNFFSCFKMTNRVFCKLTRKKWRRNTAFSNENIWEVFVSPFSLLIREPSVVVREKVEMKFAMSMQLNNGFQWRGIWLVGYLLTQLKKAKWQFLKLESRN